MRSGSVCCLLWIFLGAPVYSIGSPSAVTIDGEACEGFERRDGPARIAVISDLHLGLGAESPFEEFEWTAELEAFLKQLDGWSGQNADLVIAGDFLELWQHPEVDCGDRADLGCTPSQAAKTVDRVVAAHLEDLRILGEFADRGSNRLIVVPGNHDAALLLDPRAADSPWAKVSRQIAAGKPCRVVLVASGVWASPDGAVAVEHGHQIGTDVNAFPDWPDVLAREDPSRLFKSWGENFVRTLYNEAERDHPLVDNLKPRSTGMKYYFEGKGWTAQPKDAARFIAFNVLETSWRQKLVLAPPPPPGEKTPSWDVEFAREQLGHKLFVDSLAGDDPMRAALANDSSEWQEVRALLAERARTLPEEEVEDLCDRIALLAKAEPGVQRSSCQNVLALGGLSQLVPRSRILAQHLNRLKEQLPGLQVFVYGHTHEMDAREVWVRKLQRNVPVLNTGAFHRVIDEEEFLKAAAEETLEPAEALQRLPRHYLRGCFPAVLLESESGLWNAKLEIWKMERVGAGQLVGKCDSGCRTINRKLCSGG